MAKFDGLIEELADDLAPRRSVAAWICWVALGAGLLAMSLAFLAVMPPRPDIFAAPGLVYWRLLASLGVGVAAGAVALAAHRPEFRARHGHWAALLVALGLFLLPALASWFADGMPSPVRDGWFGCLGMTFLMGLGHLALMLLWLRRGAPAEPARAGAFAGLAAGGFAGFSYALHCTQDAAWYAGSWYGLSTLGLVLVGAWFGRLFCRW